VWIRAVASSSFFIQRPDEPGLLVLYDLKGLHMLILTRRIGETLMIGDEVTITVLRTKGTLARIGISAPRDIAVHREEVYARIQREQTLPVAPGQDSLDQRTIAQET